MVNDTTDRSGFGHLKKMKCVCFTTLTRNARHKRTLAITCEAPTCVPEKILKKLCLGQGNETPCTSNSSTSLVAR